MEIIKNFTIDDVKNIILEQDENAFGKPKKKSTKTLEQAPKKSTRKKSDGVDEEA